MIDSGHEPGEPPHLRRELRSPRWRRTHGRPAQPHSICKMNRLRKDPGIGPDAASWTEIDDSRAGQRIDNFLLSVLKGRAQEPCLPDPAHRAGAGEQRPGRCRPIACRPATGFASRRSGPRAPAARPDRAAGCAGAVAPVLLEDESLLVLDKPAGVAAHGGSGVSRGVIEQLRLERPELRFLELVHRLDRDTSGVLLLAKKRSALTGFARADPRRQHARSGT